MPRPCRAIPKPTVGRGYPPSTVKQRTPSTLPSMILVSCVWHFYALHGFHEPMLGAPNVFDLADERIQLVFDVVKACCGDVAVLIFGCRLEPHLSDRLFG